MNETFAPEAPETDSPELELSTEQTPPAERSDAALPDDVPADVPAVQVPEETSAESSPVPMIAAALEDAPALPSGVAHIEALPEPELAPELLQTVPLASADTTAKVPESPEVSEQQQQAASQRLGLMSAVFEQLDQPEERYLATLEKAALQELVVLMEALNERELRPEILRRIGPLKKRYDTAYAAALESLKDQPESEQLSAQRDSYSQLSRRFSEALRKFNKTRESFEESQRKQKEENSKLKNALLEQLRAIVTAENAHAMKEVRHIQEQWRSIGPVLSPDVEPLKLSFKSLLDQFYAMRKPLMELEDQARKLNQDIKEKILQALEEVLQGKPAEGESAEALSKYFEATHDKVRKLQEQWKQAGPVPREATETLWERFRTLTDTYYQLRKGYQGEQRESRAQLLQQAEALLEQARSLKLFSTDNLDFWRQKANEAKALNEAWYKLRPVLFRSHGEWIEEFKALMDDFFQRRSAFLSELDKGREDVLQQKEAMVEEADRLKDSEVWRETADRFKQLQRAWNDLGPDTNKEGIRLLRKFRKVSDHFFRRYKEYLGAMSQAEEANLALKLRVIEELENLRQRPAEPGEESTETQARELKARWESIGHVPLPQKDSLYKRYFEVLDALIGRSGPERGARGFGGGGYGGGSDRREGGGYGARRGGERREGGFRPERGERREGGFRNDRGGKSDRGPRPDRGGPPERQTPLTPLELEEVNLKKRIGTIGEEILQLENNLSFFAKSKGANALTADYQSQLEALQAEKVRIEAEVKALRKRQHEERRAAEQAAAEAQAAAKAQSAEAQVTPAPEETTQVPMAEAPAPDPAPDLVPVAEASTEVSAEAASPADIQPEAAPAPDIEA